MIKLNSWFTKITKARLYHPDTDNILNYLTLKISNKNVNEELTRESSEQLNKVFWAVLTQSLLVLMTKIINMIILQQEENFYMVCIGIFMIVLLIWRVLKIRLPFIPKLIMPIYFFVFCAIVITVTCIQEDSFIKQGFMKD